VSGLSAADFDIELGGKPLGKFTVDDMCPGATTPAPGAPEPRPGSYILYFDEPELTVQGRIRAIEVARLVAPALLAHGHDVMILRNGYALRTDTNWTHDPPVVSAALDRIASDPGNGHASRADIEELNVERLFEQLADGVRVAEMQMQRALRNERSASASLPSGFQSPSADPDSPTYRPSSAMVAAQAEGTEALEQLLFQFQPVVQDELRRIERDLARLSGAVRFLALRDAPKGLVYFADTLRRDPGDVLVRRFDSAAQITRFLNGPRWRAKLDSWDADGAFQAVVRDASTYGVRFYAVEGRGLALPSNWVRSSQDTLASMALETGGLFFVNGIAPPRIADQVVADQSCWYLVSFTPSGLDTDRPLNLGVQVKKPGLRVQARPSLVIPSRTTLTQTRLIAAHFDDPALQARPLSVSVYPVGGTTKSLQVLAQVRLPGNDMPQARDALWDVGFDVVSEGAIIAHKSSGVTWRGNGEPPIYQANLTLPAGSYEVVAVAYEAATESIRSGRINGKWPTPSSERIALSPPALAQPQRGGIVQDGKVRESGIVVRGAGNPVDPRVSAAFVTAACLDGTKGAVLRADRRIVGETEVSFASMDLLPDGGRCVQIRDLVAAGSLGAGRLNYVVRILSGDTVIASQELPFEVASVTAPSPEVSAPPGK
jgi:hypothetical protein